MVAMKTLLFLLLLVPHVALAATVDFGSVATTVDGPFVLTPGSCINFGDGSGLCSGHLPDVGAIWGNITGILSNQQDLWAQLQQKEEKVNKGVPNGYASLDPTGKVPSNQLPALAGGATVTGTRQYSWQFAGEWVYQGAAWADMNPVFTVSFNKLSPSSYLRLSWSDNVGIYHTNWCNVGLFLDDNLTAPVCVGAWSGVPNTTVFNQQFISCIAYNIPVGAHIIRVKHRSQYCTYGNFAFDDFGLQKILTVEEF
jgi:hypothetical protein